MLACVNCANRITLDPAAGRLPPWCPNCGASLKLADPRPAALDTAPPAHAPTLRPEGTGAPPVETTVSTFESLALTVETPWQSKMLRNAAVLCLLTGAALAYFTATDAWLWPLLLAGIGCTILLYWAHSRFR
jgi:hypothetical protein